MTRRILHLVGSAESEAFDELSQLYARGCLAATAQLDAQVFIAHVSPDGVWRFPADLDDRSLDLAAELTLPRALAMIADLDVDVMVPHMFCLSGMTHYRALFDALGIPYVGNRPDVMAMAARKDVARAVVAAHGVPVPAGGLVDPLDLTAPPLPAVVKPVDGDNSAGLTLVRRADELRLAVARARRAGTQALWEQFIAPGREVRCGILQRGGELVVLPLEEYPVDDARPVRQATDKLHRADGGRLRLVAKDVSRAWIVDSDDPISDTVGAMARRCHQALGCRHYSLFDFRIDPGGQPFFLEAGPYCSFSPQSVVATMAAAVGIPVGQLLEQMIEEAIGRSVGREPA